MKILFVTSLCSSTLLPRRGPGNARILRALRTMAECRAVVPLNASPSWLSPFLPGPSGDEGVPRVETEPSGDLVIHPRVYHIPGVARFLNAVLFGVSVAPTLYAHVKAFRPDVILAPWLYPDGTAIVGLGRLWRIPVVVRAMGSDVNEAARKLGRRSQVRWALNHASGIVAVSQALAETIAAIGVARERVSVITTGVDHAIFHPRDREQSRRLLGFPQGPVVLAPARLSAEKGLLDLLQAMPMANQVPFHLVLVGEGKQRKRLEDEVGRLALGDRVRFDGFQPEERMPSYYSAADLVCLPSHREGWPDAIMESFACGCPVVASAVGGIPEMLALTGAGQLVPAAHPVELAAALTVALQRTWDREALAQAMRVHSIEETARRYLEICVQAVEGSGLATASPSQMA